MSVRDPLPAGAAPADGSPADGAPASGVPRRSGGRNECRARFGLFELDLATGELLKGGRSLHLAPQPTRVLVLLVRRAGRLVTREELQDELWGDGTVVAYDQGLNYCIRQVREVLGDRADAPAFVETVPRRGYRFVAPVERLGAEREGPAGSATGQGGPAASGSPGTERGPEENHRGEEGVAGKRPGPRRPRAVLVVAAGLGAVLTLAVFLDMHGPSGAEDGAGGPSREGTAAAPAAAEPAGERLRLVVLPFEDLSPGGDAGPGAPDGSYLADGLTGELISHLSRLDPGRLGVISRVSAMTYRGSGKTVAEIGEELGVGHALEGTVRRVGDRLRVTAQLVRAGDQTQLWAETYDRRFQDLLEIQRDIARRVTRSLSLRLLPERGDPLLRLTTADPRAYELFLRGRYHWSRFTEEGYLAAVDHFRRALGRDPEYAEAWAALADAYNLLVFTDALPREEAFERARAAARRALGLDPQLAEAHNSLAFVRLYGDRDPRAAVESFERALELDQAFAWLERAVEAGEPWLVFLWVDPRFEPLRGDPRFGEVAQRVGIGRPGGLGARLPSGRSVEERVAAGQAREATEVAVCAEELADPGVAAEGCDPRVVDLRAPGPGGAKEIEELGAVARGLAQEHQSRRLQPGFDLVQSLVRGRRRIVDLRVG